MNFSRFIELLLARLNFHWIKSDFFAERLNAMFGIFFAWLRLR